MPVRILRDIKLKETLFKIKVKLIVIDTLAVATSGGNECTSEDINTSIVREVLGLVGKGGRGSTRAAEIMQEFKQTGLVKETDRGPKNTYQWQLTNQEWDRANRPISSSKPPRKSSAGPEQIPPSH